MKNSFLVLAWFNGQQTSENVVFVKHVRITLDCQKAVMQVHPISLNNEKDFFSGKGPKRTQQ